MNYSNFSTDLDEFNAFIPYTANLNGSENGFGDGAGYGDENKYDNESGDGSGGGFDYEFGIEEGNGSGDGYGLDLGDGWGCGDFIYVI
jgi:hypothetical protein